MKQVFGVTFLSLLLAAPAFAAEVKDTSYKEPNGRRVQQLEIVVNAPPEKVWAALTTDDGFMGWGAPVAHVTLGNDGMIEASYSLGAKMGDANNIRNRIVAYLPNRLLVLHNENVPKGAPFKAEVINQIRTVLTIEDLGGGKSRVTEAGVGYTDTADMNEMYGHFRAGNAEALKALAHYLEVGPMDWKKMADAMNASVGAK